MNKRPNWMSIGLLCFILACFPFKSLQQVPNARRYLGCFADDYFRILPDYSCVQETGPGARCPGCSAHIPGQDDGTGLGCQNNAMTVDLCLTLCLENGHAYAGLQSGTECFCGNEDAVYQKLAKDEAGCNVPCGGNPSQTCGGGFWANVYDLRKSCIVDNLDTFLFPSEATSFNNELVIFNENQRLTFTCQTGYTLNGQGVVTCQSNGDWSPAIPFCIAPATLSDVTCPSLTSLTDGSISTQQTIFRSGETARFACSAGFVLQGSDLLRCDNTGSWSADMPSCVAMQCAAPPVVANAEAVLNNVGRNVGGSVIYKCKDGFKSRIEVTGRVCSEQFEWIGEIPVCSKDDGTGGNTITEGPGILPVDNGNGNDKQTSVPALVWILIVIVIICLIIFLAGCIVIRTGSSSGPRDYKQRDPYISDGIVVTREGDKRRDQSMNHHHHIPATTGTSFVGPAGTTVPRRDPEIGIPAENYSSRATSVASGTLRGNQGLDLTETDADKYIDSLFDIEGLEANNNANNDEVIGPYHPTMGGFGTPSRGPSPFHHPEDDDYPPPPPEAHQYHDLDRQRLDTPPQQGIYADTPGGRGMDLPAHSGPSGSGSKNMYLPPSHGYPSVSDPNNAPSPVPSEDKSTQNPEKEFLDEVDDFFDGVNNKIDNCMMQ